MHQSTIFSLKEYKNMYLVFILFHLKIYQCKKVTSTILLQIQCTCNMKFMDYLWKKRYKSIFISCLLLEYYAYLSSKYNCYFKIKQKLFDAKVKTASDRSLGSPYCVYHQSTWNRTSRIEPG